MDKVPSNPPYKDENINESIEYLLTKMSEIELSHKKEVNALKNEIKELTSRVAYLEQINRIKTLPKVTSLKQDSKALLKYIKNKQFNEFSTIMKEIIRYIDEFIEGENVNIKLFI